MPKRREILVEKSSLFRYKTALATKKSATQALNAPLSLLHKPSSKQDVQDKHSILSSDKKKY